MTKEERISLRDELIEALKNDCIIYAIKNRYQLVSKDGLLFFLKKNDTIQSKYNLYVKQFSCEEEALYCLMHMDDSSNHLCPICGCALVFYTSKNNSKYRKSCGKKECKDKLTYTDESRNKIKQTLLEKYGIESPLQYEEFKSKAKETTFKRYGVEYASQSDEIKEKTKQTNLEKYGAEYPIQTKEIQDKIVNNNLEKYGVEYITQTDEFKEKSKETMLKKYGVEYASQSDEIKEKTKQTNLEKYGVKHPMQSKNIQHKFEETCLKKFGVKTPLQSENIKTKIKNIILNKYSVEYITQSEEIRKKIECTNLKKYNVQNPMQCKMIQEKVKKTNLEKYGAEIIFKVKGVMDKAKQTLIERYGVENIMHVDEIKKKVGAKVRETFIRKNSFSNPIHDNEIDKLIKDFKEYYQLNSIQLVDIYGNDDYFIKMIELLSAQKNRLLRLGEISNIFNVHIQTIHKRLKELNIENYFFIKDHDLEVQFKTLLDDNNISYIRRDRSTLYPKEIDFMINNNIGIEINDISSHNVSRKDSTYHLNKTISAKEKGIRLIHLWEWELTDQILWSRLSGWIVNLCNNHKIKIGARKCIVKEVSLEEEKKFLNQYHLQGYMKSEVCYGLYYDDQLIQLISFSKPRYNKNYQYELLRLCTKYGYIVIGGANKLLNYFIKLINPLSIISYCNLDKFDGKVYEELGFKLLKQNPPSITWYNQETNKHFSQSSLNMIGADKLLGTNYGKGTNNEEIAYQCGYEKIYNCGMKLFVYKRELFS